MNQPHKIQDGTLEAAVATTAIALENCNDYMGELILREYLHQLCRIQRQIFEPADLPATPEKGSSDEVVKAIVEEIRSGGRVSNEMERVYGLIRVGR